MVKCSKKRKGVSACRAGTKGVRMGVDSWSAHSIRPVGLVVPIHHCTYSDWTCGWIAPNLLDASNCLLMAESCTL